MSPAVLLPIAAFLFVVAASARAEAVDPDASACSEQALAGDLEKVHAACTSQLERPGLSASERAEVYVLRGRASTGLGRFAAAAGDFEFAVTLAPNRAEPRFRRARSAYLAANLNLALREALEAARLDDGYARAFDLLGLIWTDFDRARADAAFQRAIALAPSEAMFQYNRFRLLSRWNAEPEALAAADAILRMPPATLDRADAIVFDEIKTTIRSAARIERAKLLGRMGRFGEAEAGFDELVRDDPSALAYAMRADFRRFRGMNAALIQLDLDRSFALNSGYGAAHVTQAELYSDAGRHAEAEVAIRRAIALDPRRGGRHWRHAIILRSLGRIERATDVAATIVEIDPVFVAGKFEVLQVRGYLPREITSELPVEHVRDALRACMIDESCR